MAFAVALGLTACSPQEFDDHSLGGSYTFTEDQFTFEMTPGSDQWTYDYTASFNIDGNKTPYSFEIRFNDGRGSVSKDLSGSFTYNVLAGTYIAECLLYNPNGEILIKEIEIVIANDNPDYYLDDPTSLQYALTGGKDNVDGKTWFIGAWTAMRNPDNRGEVWWPFGENAALLNDEFTFSPEGTNPYGGFLYNNNGDTFMNEKLGDLFSDGDTSGSFVTEFYNAPTDATFEVVIEGEKTFLILNKGFLGYATSPADLQQTKYEVLSFSPSNIRLVQLDADNFGGWCFELTNDVPADPLFGEGEKTWVVDGYNKATAEVQAALPGEPNIKGFMGLGPVGGNQEWWGADAGDKSAETTLAANGHAWTLYDCKWTFTAGKELIIETKGEGYGRKASAGVGGFSVTAEEGDDMLFTYNGGTYTYTRTSDELTISDNGYLTYYCGVQTYEILYLSETAMCVRVVSNPEGHNWVFILCPEGEQ